MVARNMLVDPLPFMPIEFKLFTRLAMRAQYARLYITSLKIKRAKDSQSACSAAASDTLLCFFHEAAIPWLNAKLVFLT
eukprot:scaffold418770_cov21-Prasinocladus_malaysianus.AAC.1